MPKAKKALGQEERIIMEKKNWGGKEKGGIYH